MVEAVGSHHSVETQMMLEIKDRERARDVDALMYLSCYVCVH